MTLRWTPSRDRGNSLGVSALRSRAEGNDGSACYARASVLRCHERHRKGSAPLPQLRPTGLLCPHWSTLAPRCTSSAPLSLATVRGGKRELVAVTRRPRAHMSDMNIADVAIALSTWHRKTVGQYSLGMAALSNCVSAPLK